MRKAGEDQDKAMRLLIDELETAVWALGRVVGDGRVPWVDRAQAGTVRAQFRRALVGLRATVQPPILHSGSSMWWWCMSKSWRKGQRGADYRHYRTVVRPAVLRRDGYRCQLQLPGTWPVRGGVAKCLGVADCVHHTHGIGNTGHDMRYMVASCTPCNLKVGDPTRAPDPPTRLPRWIFS